MQKDKSLLHRAKLRALGLPIDSTAVAAAAKPKLTFKLYFPQPPYRGAKYTAALSKTDKLFNFVGLVLGHHGKTIQRIQKASGARVEVHDASGNLNGEHPAHDDPSLHALILADSRPKLDKAVSLLLEVLAPTNTTYQPIKVVPGGAAFLRPVIPADWPEAAEEHASPRSEHEASACQPPAAPLQPNVWASGRSPLAKQGSDLQAELLTNPGSTLLAAPSPHDMLRAQAAAQACASPLRQPSDLVQGMGASSSPLMPPPLQPLEQQTPPRVAHMPALAALSPRLAPSPALPASPGPSLGSAACLSPVGGPFSPAALSPSSACCAMPPLSLLSTERPSHEEVRHTASCDEVAKPQVVIQYCRTDSRDSQQVATPQAAAGHYCRTDSRDSQRSAGSVQSCQSEAREFSLWSQGAPGGQTAGNGLGDAGSGGRFVSFYEELQQAACDFLPAFTSDSSMPATQASQGPQAQAGAGSLSPASSIVASTTLHVLTPSQSGAGALSPPPITRGPSLGSSVYGSVGTPVAPSGPPFSSLGSAPSGSLYSSLPPAPSGMSSLAPAASGHSLASIATPSLTSAGSASLYSLSPAASFARLPSVTAAGPLLPLPQMPEEAPMLVGSDLSYSCAQLQAQHLGITGLASQLEGRLQQQQQQQQQAAMRAAAAGDPLPSISALAAALSSPGLQQQQQQAQQHYTLGSMAVGPGALHASLEAQQGLAAAAAMHHMLPAQLEQHLCSSLLQHCNLSPAQEL